MDDPCGLLAEPVKVKGIGSCVAMTGWAKAPTDTVGAMAGTSRTTYVAAAWTSTMSGSDGLWKKRNDARALTVMVTAASHGNAAGIAPAHCQELPVSVPATNGP